MNMSNIGTCSKCGNKDVKVVNHHTDYENDITIVLCYPCHKKLHAALRRNGTPLSPPTEYIPTTGVRGLKFVGRVGHAHHVTIPEEACKIVGINAGDLVYMEIIEVKPHQTEQTTTKKDENNE